MPFDDFRFYNYQIPHDMGHHYADDVYLPHQMPAHYADDMHSTHQRAEHYDDMRFSRHRIPEHYDDMRFSRRRIPEHYDDMRFSPHRIPEHYDDMRFSPHRIPEHYDDMIFSPHRIPEHYDDMRFSPHQIQEHYDDTSLSPHRISEHYDDMRFSPHRIPEYYDDMRISPHRIPEHYDDMRFAPHQIQEHYDDMSLSPHRIPEHYDDLRFLPHRNPEHYDDMRFIPHQTPAYYDDNRHLTHQRPEHYADKRPLPHQTAKDFSAKRNLPHQRPKHYSDMRHLPHPLRNRDADNRPAPHQRPKHYADKRYLPHPLRERDADNRLAPHQTPEDFPDKSILPQQKPKHCADKRHIRQTMPKNFADKRILPHQKMEVFADKRDLQHQKLEDTCSGLDAIARAPQQGPMTSQSDLRTKVEEGKVHREVQNCGTEECAEKVCSPHPKKKPTVPVVATVERVQCEICNIMVSLKSLEEHYNGKRHRRMLHDQSTKQKTSIGEESRHIQNSQMNPVVQTPDLPHQTPENYDDKKCLPHQTPEPTIPAELVHCETSDVISPVKCLEEHNGGKKHRRMLSKPCGQSMKDGSPVENISHKAPRFRYKEVPAEGSKRKVRDNTDAKGNVFKRKVEEATGGKYMKMNNGIKRLVKSSKLNDLSNSAQSLVQIAELTPSYGHVASPKLAPVPAEGSSFELASQHVSPSLSQESTGKEHHEFQNTTVEQNDQPQSGLVELNASAESMSCDFAGNAPPQVPVTSPVYTPVEAAAGLSLEPSIQIDSQKEGNAHLEVQNYGVETNDQPHSIATEFHAPAVSMELHDLAGSMTTNQTEVVNSDSAAIVVEPLASTLQDAVGPSFEPLTEHGLHTETEPEVLEAIVYYESRNPQSDLMEIDADSEVRTETKTADGSLQVEEEMDVLSDESGKVQLPQVSVCLKCGDEGFEETLVYCNKCEDYALHRYCLDGPVIFTDEVIWLCEDCDKEEVDTDYPDSETANSEKGKVDSSEDFATVADPQPIADPIWK